jgi:hypothetical protein
MIVVEGDPKLHLAHIKFVDEAPCHQYLLRRDEAPCRSPYIVSGLRTDRDLMADKLMLLNHV